MKITGKEEKITRRNHTVGTKYDKPEESTELKTDYPLSEKDEVKLAERKMQKLGKKLL